MKRYLFIILLMLFIFAGCDYDEKSFQALSNSDIPEEVTMYFELPRGVYAEFVWTSSNEEVLIISNRRHVMVIQQEEDVEVTIKATINQTSREFIIKVLKIGSTPTPLEQSIIALENLELPDEVILPFEVITEDGNIAFEYFGPINGNQYEVVEKTNGTIWIVPRYVNVNLNATVVVKAYYKEDDKLIYLSSKTVKFLIQVDKEKTHEHANIFNDIKVQLQKNTNLDNITEDFELPISSNLNEEAEIVWKSSDKTTISISVDGKTANVHNKSGVWNCTMIVTITIDEISYEFSIVTTVYPQDK